ncbi:hypothetical protein BLA6863_01837 [Burkholderia lata]|uniref:Uncharacterized protein n=1 Tax=Burkholderia lata (strain ATCC 17760 / DSM 23089 / LMG 22485 / NCIMB 9086 / R18194 / 383) TaxID=482957 RepID=A0A6P2JBF3_BURL3|nr:hypothetical protein BLA6863_01837 [Burkholderia lata]
MRWPGGGVLRGAVPLFHRWIDGSIGRNSTMQMMETTEGMRGAAARTEGRVR